MLKIARALMMLYEYIVGEGFLVSLLRVKNPYNKCEEKRGVFGKQQTCT